MSIDYRTIIKQAVAFGIKNRLSLEKAEEFAQEVAIVYFKAGTANFNWALTDFLRHEYGRTGVWGSTASNYKSHARNTQISLDEPIKTGETDGITYHEIIADTHTDSGLERGDWKNYCSFRNRAVIIAYLRIELELSLIEIGDLLGVSESRICQLFKPIRKSMQRLKSLEDHLDDYHLYPHKSQMIINWITL
jgi:hypothetical protein